MANPKLINYIKTQLQQDIPRETIVNSLISQGWRQSEINEGFSSIESSSQKQDPFSQPFSTLSEYPERNINKAILVIASIIGILAIGTGIFGYFYLKNEKSAGSSVLNTPSVVNNTPTNAEKNDVNQNTSFVAPSPTPTIDNNAATSDDLWPIFDKNADALKNKNIEAFNATSYKKITAAEESQFYQLASFLYSEMKKINKDDYTNKYRDDNQAIYSTNPVREDSSISYSYKQGFVMFVKKDGLWKLLSIIPNKEWSISKSGTNETPEQIEKDLQEMILDSDKDGITDMDELCKGAQEFNPQCVKTDPRNRDTDGDGWWDGIEANF